MFTLGVSPTEESRDPNKGKPTDNNKTSAETKPVVKSIRDIILSPNHR